MRSNNLEVYGPALPLAKVDGEACGTISQFVCGTAHLSISRRAVRKTDLYRTALDRMLLWFIRHIINREATSRPARFMIPSGTARLVAFSFGGRLPNLRPQCQPGEEQEENETLQANTVYPMMPQNPTRVLPLSDRCHEILLRMGLLWCRPCLWIKLLINRHFTH